MARSAIERQRERALRPLFEYLEQRGIKQTWLANKLRLTRFQLANIKAGRLLTPDGFLERACAKLGITVEELSGRPSRRRKVSA